MKAGVWWLQREIRMPVSGKSPYRTGSPTRPIGLRCLQFEASLRGLGQTTCCTFRQMVAEMECSNLPLAVRQLSCGTVHAVGFFQGRQSHPMDVSHSPLRYSDKPRSV